MLVIDSTINDTIPRDVQLVGCKFQDIKPVNKKLKDSKNKSNTVNKKICFFKVFIFLFFYLRNCLERILLVLTTLKIY